MTLQKIIGFSAITISAFLMATPSFAIANPASVFCEEIGGKSIIKKDKQNNDIGVCQFKNGKEVDEWKLFRAQELGRPERPEKADGKPPKIGMANPASEHCEKIGGKAISQKDNNGGEKAMCQLSDGKTVDAWELLRSSDKK